MSMLSFEYTWLALCFYEFATFIYFIITGYYFQPLPTNPYTLLASDLDLDEEIVFSLSDTGNEKGSIVDSSDFDINQSENQDVSLLEGTHKIKRRNVEDIV